MWKIGNVTIKNQFVLAPIAGVSNPAYLKIAQQMGCGWAITELISAEAIIRGNQKTFEMLNGIDELTMPISIQLFGSNKDTLAKAAQIINQKYPKNMIDINMGCPVPKVAISANSGSGLLKTPEKVYEIVKAVTTAVDVPVTVKIRSGWDSNSINAVQIAKLCEKAGAKAITIHARTRSQGYSGKADWNIIKQVKENVKIPVIGNGDIKTPQDAQKMLYQTNCDAIMVGRAALGNPWLIKNTIHYLKTNQLLKNPTTLDKINMIKKHFNYLLKIKNEKTALLEMRTNTCYYLKGMPNTSNIKKELFQTKTKEEFLNVIDKLKTPIR